MKTTQFKEKYGQYALVVGGSDGLGAAFAEAIARRGLNLVLIARQEDRLKATADRLRETYKIDVISIAADNMQKYFFKITPGRKFLWIKPEVLSDGKLSLLANGYWGASRHINYLGEIVQALAEPLPPATLRVGWYGCTQLTI